jgi:transposase InsO family protein
VPAGRSDEVALTADIVALATQYGRYGYRRIAAILHASGWAVNIKRVERIWRREGLKVPARQPKKGRLWLDDGVVHPASARTSQPCLVLRLCRGSHP